MTKANTPISLKPGTESSIKLPGINQSTSNKKSDLNSAADLDASKLGSRVNLTNNATVEYSDDPQESYASAKMTRNDKLKQWSSVREKTATPNDNRKNTPANVLSRRTTFSRNQQSAEPRT